MQAKSRVYEAGLPGVRIAESIVAACAKNAKAYWSWWGPLGKPMICGIEAWEDMQRGYLQSLSGAPRVVKSTEEAERSFTKVEAAVEEASSWDESEHPREAEGQFTEAKAPVAFDESKHPRDAEGQFVAAPPTEDYDSLNVQKVLALLSEMSTDELQELRAYEAEHKNRKTLLERADTKIEAGLPLAGYDSLNVPKVHEQLSKMSIDELKDLWAYEAEHKNRKTLLELVDAKIEAGSNDESEHPSNAEGQFAAVS